MAKFVELAGEDPSSIYASINQGGQNRNTPSSKHSVVYIPLPQDQMLRIYDYYHTQEPMIGIVNSMKDFSSLGDKMEVEATFGGREIPEPERTQVNEALNKLLPEFRAWYDMFGFVGVYDPNAYMDRQVAEITEQDTRSASNAFQLRNDLIENIDESIADLAPMLGDGGVQQLRNRVLRPGDETSGAESDATNAVLHSEKEEVIIHTEPRVSANSAPNATATIRGRNAGDLALSENRTRVKIRRGLMQTIASIQDFQVASLKEGRFYLERDRLNGHERVVYARIEDNSDIFMRNERSSGVNHPVTALKIDPDVFVFVWPGSHPLHNGRINTKMEEVMRLRDLNAEAEENLSHADRQLAFPTAIYEYRMAPNSGDVTRLTDQQIHFNRGDEEDAVLAERLRQEGRDMAAFEAHANLMNERRMDELTRRLALGVERRTVVTSDGRRQIQTPITDKYVNLPEGFHYAGTLAPKTLVNTNERRYNYRTALASALSVPLSIIEGGSTFSSGGGRYTGGSGASVSTGSAVLSSSAMITAIMSDRAHLKMVVAALWDLMFRETDNEMLSDSLSSATIRKRRDTEKVNSAIEVLKQKLELETEAAEQAKLSQEIEANNSYLSAVASRFERIATELRAISSMSSRFEIEFKKMTHIAVEDLILLRENFAITEFDFANALRQKVGLTQFSNESEWEKIKNKTEASRQKTEEKNLQLQSKYSVKAGAGSKRPGEGGEPAKKKANKDKAQNLVDQTFASAQKKIK